MEKVIRKKNVGNKRLKILLITALANLVLASALLFGSGFGFVDALRGPKTVSSIGSNDEGSYVLSEINNIAGYYAEDFSASGGNVKGRYAAVYMDGVYVTVHLPRRYLDSADIILDATKAEMDSGKDGRRTGQYFLVSGTVRELNDTTLGLMYDWYGANIAQEADFADVLSPYSIEVDKIGGMNYVAVCVLSIAAALCLAYTAVILILAAVGRFDLDEKAVAAAGETGESEADDSTEKAETVADGGEADDSTEKAETVADVGEIDGEADGEDDA